MLKLAKYIPISLIGLSFLSACQTTGGKLPPVVDESVSQSQDILKQMARAQPHTIFTMGIGDSHDTDEIITGIPYTSARGRECIPLLDLQRNPIGQLICERVTDEWYLQQTLSIRIFDVLENM